MGSRLRLSAFGLISVMLLAPAALLAAPADPDSSQYWLVPYVQQGWLTPNPPMPGEPITLTLIGYFPYDCGEIADTNVVSTRIEFTMHKASATCADTVRSWTQVFSLGALSAGLHTITVVRKLVRENDSTEVREASFEIRVGEDPSPPPPSCPLFSHFTTNPTPAKDDEPTRVTIFGCFPYPCGGIVQTQFLGPTHVEVTMAERSCPDSGQVWAATFDLGLLAAGRHNLRISVRDTATPLVHHQFGGWLDVLSANPPTSAPPTLIAARPNPFVTETQFGIVLDQAVEVEIGIHDICGRSVKRIFRGAVSAGTRTFAWDGHREDGLRATAGVYYYRVTQPGHAISRPVVLLPGP
jgi:hypothetical protein